MSLLGLNIVDLLVILTYFALVLWIGYRAMKKVRNSEDYFLGGRQFGKFFQSFSQFGQATSSESAVNSVAMVGANGLAAAFSSMVGGIMFNPIAWLFPKWLRRSRLVSMGEYFVERFNSRKLAGLYAIAQAALFIIVGAMGLYAMSKTVCTIAQKPVSELTAVQRVEYDKALRLEVLESTPVELLTTSEGSELSSLRELGPKKHFSYINQKILITVMAIFILLYAAGGGLEAAVYTDAMQSIFILILTLMLVPFAMIKLNDVHATSGLIGPFQALHRVLPESLFEIFGSPRWVEFKWYNIMIIALMGIGGNIAFANNLVVSGAARTEKIASWGGLCGTLIKGVSTLFWMVLAMLLLGLFGEQVSDPDMMWGLAARTLLPTGLLGLMIACLLAALMSTADTHMITVSGLLTHNIYKPLLPGKPDAHYVTVGRVMGVVYIVGAVLLAFNSSNVFRMLKVMIFIIIACGPSMLMGFLWRRTNAKAVWASMGTSLVITLFIPMLASFSTFRENPSLLTEVRTPAVVKTYTASERDVQSRLKEMEKWDLLSKNGLATSTRPTPLESGQKFSKTYQPAPRALFWDQNVKARKDGTRYGDGLFKPELYALHLMGVKLQSLTPAQVEAVSLLIRLIFPFAAVFIVGLLTAPMPKGHLDSFYARQRTPVNEDPDQDKKDVEYSMAHPDKTVDTKMFPGSNWEITRPAKYDVIGMSIGSAAALVLTIAILLLSKLGK